MQLRHVTLPTAATALVLCAATTAGAATSDWNTGPGGNSARDCLSMEVGPDAAEILWDGSLPAIVAQQAVIGDGLAVMARITSFTIPTGTTIIAHELETGDVAWTTQLPFTLSDEWRSRVSAIRDGLVYATRAGNANAAPLYALDVADGEIVWPSEGLIDEATTEGLAFASNGDPVLGNFGEIVRIDRLDGTTVWTTPRTCPTGSGCLVSVFGERAYYYEASVDGPVVTALDLETGNPLYSSEGIGGGFIQQLGLFVGPDGTIYAPRTQNNPATDFLVAFEDTGTAFVEKWRVPIGYMPFGTMGVGPDGSVYTYVTDQGAGTFNVLRLEPAGGAIVDTSPDLPFDFPLQPRMAIDAAGRIFLTNGGFAGGRLYSLNADLSERWSEPVTNVNVGGPAIGPGGVLVVCGVGDDVRAYRTGTPCPADVANDDGVVNVDDLLAILAAWGSSDPAFDVVPDGIVDVNDLLAVLAAWGAC